MVNTSSNEASYATASVSGVGFFSLLTIALIILKLTGLAAIPWSAIVAVFFAPFIIITSFLLIVGVVIGIAALVGYFRS